MSARQVENRAILRRILGVTFASLILVSYIEWKYSGKCLEEALYWLQMFSGSSFPATPEGTHHEHPIAFVFGAVFQVMISVGPLLGVLWLLFVVLTDRRENMFTYANVLADRDAALKLALKEFMLKKERAGNVEALKQELDGLFRDTSKDWAVDLPDLIGKTEAQEFLQELEKAR